VSGDANPAAELSAINADGKGVRVQFFWIEDRFRHQIDVISANEDVKILESLEGDRQQEWPSSPPCQNLVEGINDRGDQVVMVTGSAGDCHWSMTAEASRQQFAKDSGFAFFGELKGPTEHFPILLFDVACRIKSAPQWLGSSYRPIGNTECKAMGPFIYADKWLLGPRLNCVDPDRPVLTRESSARLKSSSDGFSIVQVVPPEHRLIRPPTTVRWTYGIFADI
jgi:hypothetical protein